MSIIKPTQASHRGFKSLLAATLIATASQSPIAANTPYSASALDMPLAAPQIRRAPNSPALRRESYLVVGNKGEEQLDVGTQGDCSSDWLFDHAEIEISAQRFGSAQFVSMPQQGCRDCAPLTIRWYHEPTGYLAFSVNVYQRLAMDPCPNPPESKEPNS